MNYKITRREFLKLNAAGLISATFTPLISICSVGTSSAVKKAAKTVIQHFADFVVIAGLKVAADTFDQWKKNLDEERQAAVDDINAKMERAGFTSYHTPVFYNNSVHVYGVGNQDKFNTCAPFYSTEGISLVEGPALIGIALSGKYWSSDSISVSDGLIPLKAFQDDGSRFEVSTSKPFRYKTNAGSLAMNYEADTPNKKGLISVVATDNNGGVLHGQDYTINWV